MPLPEETRVSGFLAYDPVLTDKDWQKKKGTVGKTKKTGVGEALTTLEKTFAKSGFAMIDAGYLGSRSIDPQIYAEARKQFLAQVASNAKSIDKAIKDAKAKTFAARKPFASDKKVLDHLLVIDRALDKLLKDTGANGQPLKAVIASADVEWQKMLKSKSMVINGKMIEDSAKLAGYGQSLREDVKAVIAAARAQGAPQDTFAEISARWGKNPSSARSCTTAINQWDQLVVREFPQLSARFHKGPALRTFLTSGSWLDAAANEANGVCTTKAKDLIKQVGHTKAMEEFVKGFTGDIKKYDEFVVMARKFYTTLEKLV